MRVRQAHPLRIPAIGLIKCYLGQECSLRARSSRHPLKIEGSGAVTATVRSELRLHFLFAAGSERDAALVFREPLERHSNRGTHHGSTEQRLPSPHLRLNLLGVVD